MVKNPFQYGRELGADQLIDREREVAEVVDTIKESGKLFLVGPRRYGKTSILAAAQQQAEAEGAVVLRFDAEAFPSIEALVKAALAQATEKLSGSLTKAGDSLRQFFKSLKPQINYSLTDQTISAEIGVATDPVNQPEHIPLLVELLHGIEKLAVKAKTPIGFIIDEFQQIIVAGGEQAEAQIRAAIQQHKHIGYIFAGSKTRLLADMTGNPARPFYHLGERCFIAAVPRADFSPALKANFALGKINASDAAIQLIQDLAEDVPYNVQRLAHACWDHKIGERTRLSEDDVQQALEFLLREDDSWYTQLWNQVTTVQKTALLQVLRANGTGLQSKAVLRAAGLTASSMQRALQTLQDKEILRVEEKLGTVRLRLIDPFFQHWLKLIGAL
jgi:hypothetical protein